MRVALALVPALALAITTARSASSAAADPLRFAPGFAPHPYVTAKLEARVDDSRVYDRGWTTCDGGGGMFTTKAPILTWDLDAPMSLRIRLENALGDTAGGGGIIVLPDGSYVCDDSKNQFFMSSWPRGHYQLYLSGISIGVSAIVRFEDPGRSKAELARALAALPTVALGAADALNPRHEQLAPTVVVDAGDAGPTCAKARQRVMPLARLDVRRASRWYVASASHALFVITADGQCLDPTEAGTLGVGTHTLWTRVPPGAAADAAYPLEVDDRAAALALASAERHEAEALDAPLVIAGTVRPAERWYARAGACRGAARAPDLYLHSDRPLQHVTLSLLWAPTPQRLHVLGPLEQLTPTSQPGCGDDRGRGRTFDLLEGTYAVWVGGDATAAGTDYHVLVLRDGVAVDPLATLAPIPERLTLADRALANHYPYFRGATVADWTALLTTVPDRLFVYTRAAIDDDRAHLPAGEPVLVVWSNRDRTLVNRYDGSTATIDTRLLDDARPAQVALPTRATVPEATSVSRATDLAGPEDAKALAAYRKLDDKYGACLGNYLAAHDPTWGHNHEVYKISAGGRVVNVSDQVGAAGARKCGERKVIAAQGALIKQLARTRAARHAAHLAAVRARFGL